MITNNLISRLHNLIKINTIWEARWLRNIYLIISLLFFIFTLSSCFYTKNVLQTETVLKDIQVPYQAEAQVEIKAVAVFQFTSDDVNNFIYENNDLKVRYNFHGRESTIGTMVFKIENKTNQNTFIDLAYSSFINNGRATNYTDAVDITGKVLLIPDNSYLELDKFQGITNANKGNIETIIKETFDSKEKFKLFSKDNSPLSIRNKITYGFQENITSPKIIDNKFWVNQLNVYSQKEFESLPPNKLKNKLIYHSSFMGKGYVTKYRTETQEVDQDVIKRKKKFAPGRTILLVGGIITGVIVLYISSLSESQQQ